MGKENKSMPFFEWMNQINNANMDISNYRDSFDSTYAKLSKEERKHLYYRNTYVRLYNIMMKLYKWTLPEGMNARAIEMGYITRGQICVAKFKEGTFALPCIAQNRYNIYGDPVQVYAFGYNGFNRVVDIKYDSDIPTNIEIPIQNGNVEDKGVGIYSRDNDLTYPYIYYIKEYADKISDKLIALNIATQRLKCPQIYAATEFELKDTVQDLMDKIENNEDQIIMVKSKKLESKGIKDCIEPLSNNNISPDIIRGIKESIVFDMNQFLETCGINTNPNPDKSEVVLTTELNSNNDLIGLEQKVRFANRQKLCEDAKKMGITMSVEKNTTEIEEMMSRWRKETLNESEGKPEVPKPTP